MAGEIFTGTASWTDPGFVEAWYPPKLPASQRLHWYAQHFRMVEVNSTFYGVPDPQTVKKWCDQTPEGFLFDVKLHRFLSRHSTKPEFLPAGLRAKAEVQKGKVMLTQKLEKAVLQIFLRGIEPLQNAGKLGALLLQLSPSFSPRNHHLNELDQIVELLRGYKFAIELRNGGWISKDNFPATKKYFAERKVAFVMVDSPDDPHFMVLPSVDLITTPKLSYIRAHGRNAPGYIRGRTVATRFDYDYPREELEEIADRAVKAAKKSEEVHVVYNNNKADYAPRAAMMFQRILEEEHHIREPFAAKEKELAYA